MASTKGESLLSMAIPITHVEGDLVCMYVMPQTLLSFMFKLLGSHVNYVMVSVTALGQLQPHSTLKAWQLST